MARNNKIDGSIIFVIILAVIFALYFISKILFVLGIIAIIAGIGIVIFGFGTDNVQVGLIGIIVLIIGLFSISIGHVGIDFFEQNPTGKNLLDASNSVVDVSAKSYVQTSEMNNEIKRSLSNIAQNVNEANK